MRNKKWFKPVLCTAAVALVVFGAVATYSMIRTGANEPFVPRNEREDFVVFNYPLKESYATLEEVDAALQEVTSLYKSNIQSCTEAYVAEQREKFAQITAQLMELRNAFPQAKSVQPPVDKEEEFKRYIEDWAMYYRRDRKVIEGKVEPVNIQHELSTEVTKKNYDICMETKEQYENGKITLDEAYARVSVLKFPSSDEYAEMINARQAASSK